MRQIIKMISFGNSAAARKFRENDVKYPMFLHWSEGLFLQPHHFQQFQRVINDAMNAHTGLAIPYMEGICDAEIDMEALKSRRVVINSVSAVMPDGLFLSMPGNCQVTPCVLEPDPDAASSEIMVYLAVPYYSATDSNLCQDNSQEHRRYLLHETAAVDENTGDNETTVFKRSIAVRLITDPRKASDCAVLPLMKLKWVSAGAGTPILEKVAAYTPPLVILSGRSNIFAMTRDLLFELKSCKSQLLADLESSGFEPGLATGATVLRIMELQSLNVSIASLSNLLVPDKFAPFQLYQALTALLASLRAISPLSDSSDIPAYDHYNLYGIFSETIKNISAALNARGQAAFITLDFAPDSDASRLVAVLSPEDLAKAGDFYVAFEGELSWKDLIGEIESGDSFRLIDRGSIDSRVRGVRLCHSRFPPRYLPVMSSNTVYFKVMKDESARMWRYIMDDKAMVLDYAPSMNGKFSAKLYILTDNSQS